jgi:hypothetical protein
MHMTMPVMQVGKMRMPVDHRRMPVPVAVRLARGQGWIIVVLVPLSQVQPHDDY